MLMLMLILILKQVQNDRGNDKEGGFRVTMILKQVQNDKGMAQGGWILK